MRRRWNLVVAVTVVAVLSSWPAPGWCHDRPQEHAWKRIRLPDHGVVLLSIPVGWNISANRSADSPWTTITLGTGTGSHLSVVVTVAYAPDDRRQPIDISKVRKTVEANRNMAAPSATTRELPILELHGEQFNGYYFSATDRHPKPGERPNKTQGSGVLHDLLLTFTIFSDPQTEPQITETLTMLRSAKWASL